MIPTLETERLILRAFTPGDLDALAAMMADPDVMRYLTGAPASRNDTWRSIAFTLGHWSMRGYGLWAVERKSDSAMIGRIGLLNPEGWQGVEVAWTLGKPYWGQGYAVEAARASMDYGFLTQDVPRLISLIDVDNLASQKVAERIGETRGEKTEIVNGGTTFVVDIWSITREEWRRGVQMR